MNDAVLSPREIASEISLIDHQISQLESRRCSLLVLAAQQQTDKEDALLFSLEDSSVSAGDEATFFMSALPPPPPLPSSMTAMEEEDEVANDQFPTCAKILEEEPVPRIILPPAPNSLGLMSRMVSPPLVECKRPLRTISTRETTAWRFFVAAQEKQKQLSCPRSHPRTTCSSLSAPCGVSPVRSRTMRTA